MAGWILERLVAGEELRPEQEQALVQWELMDRERAAALGITPETVQSAIAQRIEWLQRIYPLFCSLCDRLLGHPANYLVTLWNLWLPLAQQLAAQRQPLNRPWIQGILGGQGTGKTTLGKILTLILEEQGYQTLSWSLDDLYKTYADRLLLQQQDPRLIWRGPPGTHDVDLGIQVLDQLRYLNPHSPLPTPHPLIPIPRFDKSLHNGMGDRTTPDIVETVDIVLFEGWFVGCRPVDLAVFDQAPEPIRTAVDRAFALDMNANLRDYLPLWERLDSLWILHLTDYRLSKQWRLQAEHQMQASGKPGMSDEEVEAFVEYFWKALHPDLFIHPLLEKADLVIEINADRSSIVRRGHSPS
ncbi:glycerate kinase [Leptodesmis sp.]|uniref:glycerate kinase n=1 Tax=Leptodesmis sp. TaxID=3100501 RepID=UPI004053576C